MNNKIGIFEDTLYEIKENKFDRLNKIKGNDILKNTKNINEEVKSLNKEMELKNEQIKIKRNTINDQIEYLEDFKRKDEHSKLKILQIQDSIKDMQGKLSDLDANGIPKHIMSEFQQTKEL